MIEFTYQTHKTGPYREVFREFESSKGLPKVHRPRETSEATKTLPRLAIGEVDRRMRKAVKVILVDPGPLLVPRLVGGRRLFRTLVAITITTTTSTERKLS